jgi:uncharacterized membrane protein YqjE
MSDSDPKAGANTAGAALKVSLRTLGATLLGVAQTRLELLALELEDEKRRVLGVLAWGAVAIMLGGFGLFFLAGWLTVLFWESHRLLALGGFALGFLSLGALALWRLRGLMGSSEGWLSASLGEIEADRQALEGVMSEPKE